MKVLDQLKKKATSTDLLMQSRLLTGTQARDRRPKIQRGNIFAEIEEQDERPPQAQ